MSHSNKLQNRIINLTLLIGLVGVLIGGVGAHLAHLNAWVRFFDNLHWTFATVTVAIIAWLKYRRFGQDSSKSLLWISSGFIAYAIGQVAWDIQEIFGYSGFPAPSDFLYLWLGPCVTLGLIELIRHKSANTNRRVVWLDVLTLTTAVLTFVLSVYLPNRGDTGFFPLLILIAYPTSIFSSAVTALATVLVLRLRINVTVIALIVGLSATGFSWMIWNLMALDGKTIDGSWFNISFSIALLFLGVGLSQWRIEQNESAAWDKLCDGILRLLPLAAVMMAATSIVLTNVLIGVPLLVKAIVVIGSVSVVLLAMTRQSFMLQDRDRLLTIQAELFDSQQQLRQSQLLLESIVEHIPVMVFVKRASDLNIVLLNRAWERMTGFSAKDFLGKNDYDLWTKEQADNFTADDRRVLASREVREVMEEPLTRLDGETIYLQTWKVALRNQDDEPDYLLGISIDITARKRAEEESRVAAAAFETHESIMITDANGAILRVNRAFQEMTGYSAEEVTGKNPRMLSSGRHGKEFYESMWGDLKRWHTWSGEIWDKRKSGQIYPKWMTITSVKDACGNVTEYVAVSSDITLRKKAEEDIRTLAFYDALTGLPNRRLLMDRLHSALAVSARTRLYGAVLFVDLDRFKTINDTLGHECGDQLLIEVAKRIQTCVREIDSVARLGGDEFIILLEEVDTKPEEASRKVALIAEKIRVVLTLPYMIDGQEQHSSPSIGVCLYCANDVPVDSLLKHADMAMYQAKDSGRNSVRFFDPKMQHAVEHRALLETDLRHAIPARQLELYYQLQVDSELVPVGVEALVRWIHPVRGMVSPAQFISVAEDSSLILDIGYWVMETACQQLSVWADNDMARGLSLAVNVSAKQFKQHDFVETVATLLRRYKVDPLRLKLELTESVILNDVTDVIGKMLALKELGVGLSLDDFGTGYSSLSYLKQLPIDQIKIDQSFVRDIASDPSDAVMVKTIIDMAQNFDLNVIAEGVETESQLEFLKQNGCMTYQGYLFSKPVPIAQFELLIKR